MDNKIFDGKVIEVTNHMYVGYILSNNEDFYEIGYHVMQNHNVDSMISCHQIYDNGQVKLIYFFDDMVPFRQKIQEANEVEMELLFNKLLEAIRKIEDNGFFNVQSIDLRLDRIYVEKQNNDIKLIYLPIVSDPEIDNKCNFESKICQQIIALIEESGMDSNYEISSIMSKYEDCTLKINDVILALLKNNQAENQQEKKVKHPDRTKNILMLTARDSSLVFQINQDEFVIGKNKYKVDGLILDNPTVSRVHCKIHRVYDKFYLIDLGSSNGTFLNQDRLVPNIPMPVKDGDNIRISNMDFLVRG